MLGAARVAVIGAGQAGLAVSHELATLGVEHVVFERARVGHTWRGRWDSFCPVAPNRTMSLPGFAYAGEDPEGFLPRDEIVGYLERYASSFGAPVQEGVEARDQGDRASQFGLARRSAQTRVRKHNMKDPCKTVSVACHSDSIRRPPGSPSGSRQVTGLARDRCANSRRYGAGSARVSG